ncbi:MAG: GTPase HflX [Bacteroidales bacterium]|nr:GTPase HflX [Bacteroidales bacterium]
MTLLKSNAQQCVLVGVITPEIDEKKANEYIDELEFLALTAHLETKQKFFQKIQSPNSKTFIGEGKLLEIRNYIQENQISIAIFDDELSGTQLRNIENILKCKVLDRTNLILDIFAVRAQTAYAKVQVELAQYEYMLPRLTRMWTHLERQQGGIGMRGPGEKELETDKRVIKKRISLLKEQLKRIDRQMNTQRQQRKKWVRAALVGYTNVGKSTLMNLLSKSDVFAENKLFATLDTTVRKVVIDNIPFLLSDTVGFIRKLPHHLIESFKSTLDELTEADIILHVIDASHNSYHDHFRVVNQTLFDIGVKNKPIIHIFNKIDLLNSEQKMLLQNESKILINNNENNTIIYISATQKENIDTLKTLIYNIVKEIHRKRYPFENFLYPDFK